MMSVIPKLLSTSSQFSNELIRRMAFSSSKNSYFKNLNFVRNFSIVSINKYAIMTIGNNFLNLSDSDKQKKLSEFAFKEYKKFEITESSIDKAEFELQLSGKAPPTYVTRSLPSIRKDHMTLFWVNHRIIPPFKQGSVECKFADKDVALDNLSKLIEAGNITIDSPILLVAQGCDNNEAATKLRIYLEDKFGKKTYMVVADISFQALAMARGLDAFVQEQRAKKGMAAFAPSDFVLDDSFALNESIQFKETPERLQKFGLFFRLSVVAPHLTYSNVSGIEDFTRSVIEKNDLCILHFLQNSPFTFGTLEKHHYRQPIEKELNGIKILYHAHRHKNDLSFCSWDQEELEKFLALTGGKVLSLVSTEGLDDSGNNVLFFSCIVEKKEKS